MLKAYCILTINLTDLIFSYNLVSVEYSGDIIQAYLHINGESLEYSQYWGSYFDSGNSGSLNSTSEGRISSLGGRTLHLRLAAGDALTLATGAQGHYGEFSGLWYITFCVELKQTDGEEATTVQPTTVEPTSKPTTATTSSSGGVEMKPGVVFAALIALFQVIRQ